MERTYRFELMQDDALLAEGQATLADTIKADGMLSRRDLLQVVIKELGEKANCALCLDGVWYHPTDSNFSKEDAEDHKGIHSFAQLRYGLAGTMGSLPHRLGVSLIAL